MLNEAVALLDLHDNEVVIDATAGSGGHSEAILKHANVALFAIDADQEARARTEVRLKKLGKKAERARVVVGNFGNLGHIFAAHQIKEVDKILFDLGWNIEQLESGRGFSFMHDEPLDMRYGEVAASGFTAEEILNTWEEKTIADVLFGYGEERYARRIARAIIERRTVTPIKTTFELVEIIKDAVPGTYRHGKIHPATRSFQALRIAVNDELGVLERGIKEGWKHLKPGGRIAVITFHSIEDRAVKRLFIELAKGEKGKILTKKPLTASKEELHANRPSRSAKLRALEKIRENI
jgi:16S rRNA (cytosine1402-N4)-methyltransferase